MEKTKTFNDLDSLIKRNLIDQNDKDQFNLLLKLYPFAITDELIDLIDINDRNDPIRKQFIPSLEELKIAKNEIDDPIGDLSYSKVKGIIHRYPDRVLLKPTNTCPVLCRFCFRKEAIKIERDSLTNKELEVAIEYIQKNPQIWEVIVTGGEPLLLSLNKLQYIFSKLSQIEHLGVIRIHTRLPITSPSKITSKLVKRLCINKPLYIVIHCNHSKEITERTEKALRIFSRSGIPLLSQSVLLKGINDDEKAIEALFRKLITLKVKPYYLHHLDQVKGTHHFRVPIKRGQEIMRKLRGRMSGICHPFYILDIPKGFGKVPINAQYLSENISKNNLFSVEDYKGEKHCYYE